VADQTVADEVKAEARPRRPWWSGRVTVQEILEAGEEAARPSWPRPPIVRGVLGGQQQRRRQELPTPPRRERPPDLEATAAGAQLYGPRRAVPAPYHLTGPTARVPADTTGIKLSYTPLEGRPARVVGVLVQRINGSPGIAMNLELVRGGNVMPLRSWGDEHAQHDTPIVLQPGDTLQLRVVVAGGTAGSELVIHFAIEEWT
jgi:hypothetical protein